MALVAPHWGAWIEIPCMTALTTPVICRTPLGSVAVMSSHPTGVRGLKCNEASPEYQRRMVAPHWGAWIEITVFAPNAFRLLVAPHWGAWIEIYMKGKIMDDETVAPHWGAWIEIPWTNPSRPTVWRRTPLGCVD